VLLKPVDVAELVIAQPTDAVVECGVLVECRCGLELFAAP
jgi:hypothetical protein